MLESEFFEFLHRLGRLRAAENDGCHLLPAGHPTVALETIGAARSSYCSCCAATECARDIVPSCIMLVLPCGVRWGAPIVR